MFLVQKTDGLLVYSDCVCVCIPGQESVPKEFACICVSVMESHIKASLF